MSDGWKFISGVTLAVSIVSMVSILYISNRASESYTALSRRVQAIELPVCHPMMEITDEGIVGCVLSVVGDTSVFRACYSRDATNVPSSDIRPSKQTFSDEPHPEVR